MRRRRGRSGPAGRAAWAIVAASVVVACTSNGAIRPVGSAETCGPRQGERPAAALARCSAKSVAYVETPDASGTGIVIERSGAQYVLTNAHVVDPWDLASVLLDGEYYDAPVLGVRAQEDIAVLGPLDLAGARPLSLATDATPDRGDAVYLVGYPGEAPPEDPADLEATIAGGIVSRTRSVAAFDQTFVQTDASIAGGQSGGPLFDDRGRVIGISGLSFAEEFALALTAADVAAARDRILDGDGDGDRDYPFVPTDADGGAELVRSGTLEFGDAGDAQQLWVPPSAKDRTLTFQLDLSAGLVVTITSSTTYDVLAASSNAEQVAAWLDGMFASAATERGIERTFDPDEFSDEMGGTSPDETEGREVAPGSFEVELDADDGAYVYVEAPIIEEPISVAYTSGLGVHPLTSGRDVQDVAVGDVVERVIGTFDTGDDFVVELAEGDEIEVLAESAQGDVGLLVYPPSAPLDPLSAFDPDAFEDIQYVDDSDLGLYGFDARVIVEAKVAGPHRIRLYANDQLTIAARLSLTDCADTDCKE